MSGRIEGSKLTGPIHIVQDTKLANGVALARTDHVSFSLPQLGRAEVLVTEFLIGEDSLPSLPPIEKSSTQLHPAPAGSPRTTLQ